MRGSVRDMAGRAPARRAGFRARLARVARLLTAVMLLGMALLAVLLVGQGVAVARALPAAGPAGSDTARAAAPAARVRDSAAFARSRRLLDRLPTMAPPGSTVGEGVRDARLRAVHPWSDGITDTFGGADPSRRPPAPRTPAPHEPFRNELTVEGPRWDHALRRKPLTTADPPGEAWTPDDGSPAAPDRAPSTAAAPRIVPVGLWPLWPDPGTFTDPGNPDRLSLWPKSEFEGFGSSAWPGVDFPPGAALPQRDSDGRLVVPWGQVKLRSGGVRETYDGSRITADDKVMLAPQDGPRAYHADGAVVYENGITDYPRNHPYARRLPLTGTVITHDGRILTLGSADEVTGEVLRDGSYLAADGARSFVDGTRLIKNEWWFWGGMRLNARGQLLKPDGSEVDLENGTIILPRGTRVRSGGVVDFASGDVGLPGGVMVKGRIQDSLLAGQSSLDGTAAEQRPPYGEWTPEALEAQAVRVQDALDSVEYHRTRLTLAWGEPGQRVSDWDVLRNSEQTLKAEYDAIRRLVPYPPLLDGLPREELQLQAAALRKRFVAGAAELSEASEQKLSPENAWYQFGVQTLLQHLLRRIDHRAEALWAKLEGTRRKIHELGVPDTPDKQQQLNQLAAEETALQGGYDTIRQDVPFPPGLLGSSRAVLHYRAESLERDLEANTARLAELGDPEAPENRTQRYEIDRERRSLEKQLDGIRKYVERSEAPPASDSEDEPDEPPRPLRIPLAEPLLGPQQLQQTEWSEPPGTPATTAARQADADVPSPGKPAGAAPTPAAPAGQETRVEAAGPPPGPTLVDTLLPQEPVLGAEVPVQHPAPGPGTTPAVTASTDLSGSGPAGVSRTPLGDGSGSAAGLMADMSFDPS
jgi:hypothetical protein